MTDYLEEGRRIWREFVPKKGQAPTIQGELLRAVEKLRDEAMRNGNGNWDQGFEILLAYLERHLPDPMVFPRDEVVKIQAILSRLHDYERPLLDEASYDVLGDRVCDYYRHHGSRPHVSDPRLWR